MKLLLVLAMLVAAAMAGDTYDNNNDDFDIEALIANTDELKKFCGCFLDTYDCSPVPAEFKKDMKEAFEQACKKCTAAQKHLLKRFIEGIKEKLPEDYEAFKKKYDPESKYFTALEQAIAH